MHTKGIVVSNMNAVAPTTPSPATPVSSIAAATARAAAGKRRSDSSHTTKEGATDGNADGGIAATASGADVSGGNAVPPRSNSNGVDSDGGGARVGAGDGDEGTANGWDKDSSDASEGVDDDGVAARPKETATDTPTATFTSVAKTPVNANIAFFPDDGDSGGSGGGGGGGGDSGVRDRLATVTPRSRGGETNTPPPTVELVEHALLDTRNIIKMVLPSLEDAKLKKRHHEETEYARAQCAVHGKSRRGDRLRHSDGDAHLLHNRPRSFTSRSLKGPLGRDGARKAFSEDHWFSEGGNQFRGRHRANTSASSDAHSFARCTNSFCPGDAVVGGGGGGGSSSDHNGGGGGDDEPPPEFEHPTKARNFVKELKSLEMLTEVLYSVAMGKLNATLEHYRRDTIVLELEHEEAPLLRNPVHLLTIGRCVILSFQMPKDPVDNNGASPTDTSYHGMFAPRPLSAASASSYSAHTAGSGDAGGGRSIFSSGNVAAMALSRGGSGHGAVAGWSSTASVRSMVSASGQSTDSEDGMERWFDTDFFREDGGPPGEYELEPFPKAASSLHSLYHDAEEDDAHFYSLPGTPRASPPDRESMQGMPIPGGGGGGSGDGGGRESSGSDGINTFHSMAEMVGTGSLDASGNSGVSDGSGGRLSPGDATLKAAPPIAAIAAIGRMAPYVRDGLPGKSRSLSSSLPADAPKSFFPMGQGGQC